MSIKRIFIAISAIFSASAVFADNSSVTSKKYVDDLMSGYQGKLPGSGANTLMIYDDEAGIGEKSIETTLVSNATGVPTVGAVKTGLDGKQDTITGTAGYVMTGTGTPGEVGERAIYGTAVYSNSLVTAETVNTGVTNAVNSSLIRVDTNGNPSDNGILWEINTDLYAIGVLPPGYTQLEWIRSSGTQCINTGYQINPTDKIETSLKVLSVASSPADNFFFGVQNFDQTLGGMWLELYHQNSGSLTWYVRFSSFSSVYTGAESILNQDLNIELYANNFKVNGTTILTPSYVGTMQSTPITLFGRYSADGQTFVGSNIQVSSFVVRSADNSLKLNLVPAKNSSNIIGMYDTVSGQFFPNACNGTFADGPAVGN